MISAVLGAAVTATASFLGLSNATDCKCFPGDACWPSDDEWAGLNTTVAGKLIKTVPLGSPCHGDNYDAEQCEYLRSEWQFSSIQYEDTSPSQWHMADKQQHGGLLLRDGALLRQPEL